MSTVKTPFFITPGKGASFTSADMRYTQKNDIVYAVVMEWPENAPVTIKSLKRGMAALNKEVSTIALLGSSQQLSFSRDENGLHVTLPENRNKLSYGLTLKIQ